MSKVKYKEQVDLMYERDIYSVSDLNRVTGVKENTLRTWLSRYFEERGTKQGNKRVMYSFIDCLDICIFAKIVQSISVTPDAAKIATMICSERHLELIKNVTNKVELGDYYFFVFRIIKHNKMMFDAVNVNEIGKYISENSDETFVVIPVDRMFLTTQKKILEFVLSRVNDEFIEDKKPPLTPDRIRELYKIGRGHDRS